MIDQLNAFRQSLDRRGLTLETVNILDVQSTVSGGLRRRTATAGDLDLLLTVDAERLIDWQDATFFLYGLGIYGENPSRNVGDAQVVSGIADPSKTWKLFEAWYQQNFDRRLSLLAGLYDITSEFNVIRSASELFLNASFGTNPEFASSGRNGLSTFPVSSVGLRAQATLGERLTLRAVVADGVPGNPTDPNGTEIIIRADDGLVAVAELAYYLEEQEERVMHDPGPHLTAGQPRRLLFRRIGRAARLEYDAKYALGVWSYTTDLDDLNDLDAGGDPVKRDGTYGLYGLLEHRVYREPKDPLDYDQGLMVFLQLGYADPRVNRFSHYVGGGLIYTGLVPGRDAEQTGFGFAIARNGGDFKAAQRAAGRRVNNEEVALEVTHAISMTDELVVQPNLQYVINPGTDPSVPNALVVGVRIELSVNWFR